MSDITIEVNNDEMLGRNNDNIYAIRFYSMQKQIDNQKQDIELLREREKALNDLCKQYRESIDKAIEYIYHWSTQRKIFFDKIDRHLNGKPRFYGDIADLLNILRGEDNECKRFR